MNLHIQGLNRVTDTCISGNEAFESSEAMFCWSGKRPPMLANACSLMKCFTASSAPVDWNPTIKLAPKVPCSLLQWRKIYLSGHLAGRGSTLGNFFAAYSFLGKIKSRLLMKSGIEQIHSLIEWYQKASEVSIIGFFQVAGGISGNFPICVVPLIRKDLEHPWRPWTYFAQISDSTTFYGSYSVAIPSQKITWGKLDEGTPKFVIESDATIVFPLIAQYLLDG